MSREGSSLSKLIVNWLWTVATKCHALHRLRMSNFLQVYGGLHIIFNNAGIMDSGDDNVINTPDDVIDRTLAINVKGVIYGCR